MRDELYLMQHNQFQCNKSKVLVLLLKLRQLHLIEDRIQLFDLDQL